MELMPHTLRQHPALYLDCTTDLTLQDAPGAFVRVRWQPTSGTYAVTLTGLENGALDWSEEVFVFDTFTAMCAAFSAWEANLHQLDTWQATSVVTNTPYWDQEG